MPRRLLLGALLGLVCVVPFARADKALTQKTVVLADVVRVLVHQNPDSGDLEVITTYQVKDGTGKGIGPYRNVTVGLSTAQQNSLKTFITTTVLPAINTQEGT